MKNQPVIRKTETFEDLVFEGRNKSYGAFDMNLKKRKYLIVAFLISFTGFSTAIAVPFFMYLKGEKIPVLLEPAGGVTVSNVNPYEILPPKPPVFDNIEKLAADLVPIVVVNPDENLEMKITADMLDNWVNKPIDSAIGPISYNPIPPDEEVTEEIVFSPQEQAMFLGGGIEDFRAWVVENIKYPEEAARAEVFGKVFIEFCVNKRGEVVDIKVLRKLHPSIDAEAIRVISSSPKWAPARQGGTPVKVRFVIPFSFEMQ